jgi:hypothetical protein
MAEGRLRMLKPIVRFCIRPVKQVGIAFQF